MPTEIQRLEVVEPTVAEALQRADVDMQIQTARRFPRDIRRSIERCKELATLDAPTAQACSYALKRKGKDGRPTFINGPSVRLAEIIVSAWGNIRAQTRILDVGTKDVTAQAVCHDLESNVAIAKEVKRRITTRDGRRYGDDMIMMTCNAAASIALRNAIFAVIPKAYWQPVWDGAQNASFGDDKPIEERRSAMLEAFKGLGMSVDQVLSVVKRDKLDDVDIEDIKNLGGVFTSLRDGEMTVESLTGNGSKGEPKSLKDMAKKEAAKHAEEPVKPKERPQNEPEAQADGEIGDSDLYREIKAEYDKIPAGSRRLAAREQLGIGGRIELVRNMTITEANDILIGLQDIHKVMAMG